MSEFSVYSTMSSDVDYTYFETIGEAGQGHTIDHTIRIRGKANLADKVLVTPRGAVTAVTAEEAERLESHPVFKVHLANGFVAIERRGTPVDKVVDDMVQRDESSPLEPVDFEGLAVQPMKLVSQQQQEAAAAEEVESATVKRGAKRATRKNTTKATK